MTIANISSTPLHTIGPLHAISLLPDAHLAYKNHRRGHNRTRRHESSLLRRPGTLLASRASAIHATENLFSCCLLARAATIIGRGRLDPVNSARSAWGIWIATG